MVSFCLDIVKSVHKGFGVKSLKPEKIQLLSRTVGLFVDGFTTINIFFFFCSFVFGTPLNTQRELVTRDALWSVLSTQEHLFGLVWVGDKKAENTKNG